MAEQADQATNDAMSSCRATSLHGVVNAEFLEDDNSTDA
jgi:hypothetical protein